MIRLRSTPCLGWPYSFLTFGLALMLALGGCSMPTEPEGAGAEGMSRIGDQLSRQGDDEGAANFYQRALQRNPADTKARVSLGAILVAHGDQAGALRLYEEGLQAEPQNIELLRGYGRLLLQSGRAAEARDVYMRILQQDSDDVKGLNGLGVSLDFLGQHPQAQQAYLRALHEESGDYTSLGNLGHSYVLNGDYDAAIQLLEPYATDKNAPPALRQNLAEAYGFKGMYADAERMGRMDLPPDQVKKNLSWYRSERLKMGLVAKYSADLGSYPTEALGQGMKSAIEGQFGDAITGLVVTLTPAVNSMGGTPHFSLQASGFANSARLNSFCGRLKAAGYGCKPHVNSP